MARLPDVLPHRPGFFADKWGNLGSVADLRNDISRWAIKTNADFGIFGIPDMFRYQDSSGALASGEGRILVTGLYYMHASIRFDIPTCSGLVGIRMLIDINKKFNQNSGYTVVSRDFECRFSVRHVGPSNFRSKALSRIRTQFTRPYHPCCSFRRWRCRHLLICKRAVLFAFARVQQ